MIPSFEQKRACLTKKNCSFRFHLCINCNCQLNNRIYAVMQFVKDVKSKFEKKVVMITCTVNMCNELTSLVIQL